MWHTVGSVNYHTLFSEAGCCPEGQPTPFVEISWFWCDWEAIWKGWLKWPCVTYRLMPRPAMHGIRTVTPLNHSCWQEQQLFKCIRALWRVNCEFQSSKRLSRVINKLILPCFFSFSAEECCVAMWVQVTSANRSFSDLKRYWTFYIKTASVVFGPHICLL